MPDQFDAPGSAAGIQWGDYENRLLLVKALELKEGLDTVHGTKPAIRADLVVLDGPDAPEVIEDVFILPNVLQKQVRAKVGKDTWTLGRLGKGTAKPGQNPPWMLADPTEDDKQAANAYLDRTPAADGPPF